MTQKNARKSNEDYHDAKINANNYEKLHIFAGTLELMTRTRKVSDDIIFVYRGGL